MSAETLQWLFILAATTGVTAHIVLDGVANVVLAHDPYDDVAHVTRLPVLLVVALAAALAAARAMVRILDEAAGGTKAEWRPALLRFSRSQLAVLTAVFGTAVLVLLETSDVLVAGASLPDLDATFGGSLPLALAIVCATASLLCICARYVVGKLSTLRPALARVIAIYLAAIVRPKRQCTSNMDLPRNVSNARNPVWVRAGKRAPPPH